MLIKSAKFVISNTDIEKCPQPVYPEYAFIGRSNVGKSSLLNMLVNIKGLAKTSVKPGKTRLINHFIINEQWYLVDLPGYGYAKVSKKEKELWQKTIGNYIYKRKNLLSLFVLIDPCIPPQPLDMEFMLQLGENRVPFAIVFTKADKLTPFILEKNIESYKELMLGDWTELPPCFVISSPKKTGRDEILQYIAETNKLFRKLT